MARLRAGCPSAHGILADGFEHLVYRGDPPSSRIAIRCEALHTAIKRLANNKVRRIAKHIADEISRSDRDYWREQSRDVLPPSSTNSSRKKNNLPPHPPLQREETSIDPIAYAKPCDSSDGLAIVDLIDEYASNELEADVLKMLVDGYDERTIAATLAVTKYRVAAIKENFRQRAGPHGLADSA